MIFQEPMTALNPVLTIGEQIFEAFGDQKMSKKEKTERAIELLHMVGIPRPETRIKAVSYTHLDVYKRQFLGRPPCGGQPGTCFPRAQPGQAGYRGVHRSFCAAAEGPYRCV